MNISKSISFFAVLFTLFFLLTVSAQAQDAGRNVIVAGRGWDKVILNAEKSEIEKALGAGNKVSYLTDSTYSRYGIKIGYVSNRVSRITFESQSSGKDKFVIQPDKNLKWGSTRQEVEKAYGKPFYSNLQTTSEFDIYGWESVDYNSGASSFTRFTFQYNQLTEILIGLNNPNSVVAAEKMVVAEDVVVAGKGWGKIALLADKSEIEKVLGAGTRDAEKNIYSSVYLYPRHGISIDYFDGRAYKIIFKTQSTEKYPFTGKPEKSLKWGANQNQVIAVYGKPYLSDSKQTFLEYRSADKSSETKFMFENDKLVQIEISYTGPIFV